MILETKASNPKRTQARTTQHKATHTEHTIQSLSASAIPESETPRIRYYKTHCAHGILED